MPPSPLSTEVSRAGFPVVLLHRIATLILITISLDLSIHSTKQAHSAEKSRVPNIVLILADDLGYSDLGCYGGEIATSHLDRLAENGLRFTQAYNTARCWPSRAALLTGYYAQQIRRDALPDLGGGSQGTRPVWARLLPDYLKPHGYRCYHSGKWHIDGKVLDGGFDKSLDMRNQGNFFTSKGNFLDDRPIQPADDESGYYATTAVSEHAIDCLKEHAAKYTDRPFFQYVAFIAPHFPLHALPDDMAKYQGRYSPGWDVIRAERYARQRKLGLHTAKLSPLERDVGPPYAFPLALQKLGPNEVNRPLPWNELNEAQRAFQAVKMSIHAAMVDRMDREIGRLIDQLRTMGELENTVICFASDNGASAEIMVRDGGHDPSAAPGSAATYLCLGPGFSSVANTPFRRHKTWVHEGGISTPFIVHWPQGIAARGELRTDPIHFIDFVPTVMELVGGKIPETWNGVTIPPSPGKSLVPAFQQNGAVQHDDLWWLHEGNRALRVGDWKIVAAKGEPWELYDLAADRSETHNLANQQPDRVRELAARWTAEMEAMQRVVAAEK